MHDIPPMFNSRKVQGAGSDCRSKGNGSCTHLLGQLLGGDLHALTVLVVSQPLRRLPHLRRARADDAVSDVLCNRLCLGRHLRIRTGKDVKTQKKICVCRLAAEHLEKYKF